MRPNQHRLFRYPRKEYQESQEINPRRGENQRIAENALKKSKPISVEEELLRKNLHYYNYEQPDPPHHQANQGDRLQIKSEINEKDVKKRGGMTYREEEKIQFDKKLTKIMMPDQLEKIKLVKKLENKLLACLNAKKPQVPVKKLIRQDILADILGQTPRVLNSDCQLFPTKLRDQATSVKKHEHVRKNKHKNKSPPLKQQQQVLFHVEPPSLENGFFYEDSNLKQSDLGFVQQRVSLQSLPPPKRIKRQKIEEIPQFNLQVFQYQAKPKITQPLPVSPAVHKNIFHKIPKSQTLSQIFLAQPTPYDRKRKPAPTLQQFDLRNLKVPKLDSKVRKVQWQGDQIEIIEQFPQAQENDFYFSSQPFDYNEVSQEESYKQFPRRGKEKNQFLSSKEKYYNRNNRR